MSALNELIRDQYINWLHDYIRKNSKYDDSFLDNVDYYSEALGYLHSCPYEGVLEEDKPFIDKIMKELRTQYCRESEVRYNSIFFPSDFTILEVLIAISLYCENVLYKSKKRIAVSLREYNTRWWFWEIFHNIGLNKFHNDRFDEDYDSAYDTVVWRTELFMKRRWKIDSTDAPFTYRNTEYAWREDTRKIPYAAMIDTHLQYYNV